MKKQDIIKALENRKAGQALSIKVNRPAKVRKAFEGESIRKVSVYPLQLASYSKRAPVAQGIASGERKAPELPRYVKRAERHENGLTFWHGFNGQTYLALPVFGSKAASTWILEGKQVTKKSIAHKLLSSEFSKQGKYETETKAQALFNAIKLENIESIK